MRIGILTVPFNNNYGGLLQAYALKTVLTQMGNDVVFINRRRNPNKSFKVRVYKILVKIHLIPDFVNKRYRRLSVYTDIFKKKYLQPITEPYYSLRELRRVKEQKIDFYIVGSDQVWRYSYAEESICDYFFSFLDGDPTPRISYAASFGTDICDYPTTKLEHASKLLKQFRAISVREKSGCTLLHDNFSVPTKKVKVVLDPTLLIGTEQYVRIMGKRKMGKENYIFTYVLDENVIDDTTINLVCQKYGLQRNDKKAQTGDLSKLEVIAPVEDWLLSIYHSEYVITDSFHGTVFSILYNKPFIVVANKERGTARLNDLLSNFGLLDQLIGKLDKNNVKALFNVFDWTYVNERISELRSESLAFLKGALNNKLGF